MTWRERAACLGADSNLFVPTGQGNVPREGLTYCVRCPVRSDCLTDALDRQATHDAGVWGGTTERIRAGVRLGHLTRADAMARGDRLAAGHVTEDELLEEEPWLADIFAGTHAGTVGT
jgi:hypothetical protein